MVATRLTNNIRYLVKHSGGNLGEFEKSIGVSVGYFSREIKYPSIWTMYSAAKKLGVNLQDLIDKDFEQEQTIQDLTDEIEQLQKRLNTMMKEMEG